MVRSVGICTINEKKELISVNTSLVKFLGYKPEGLLNRIFTDLICPQDFEIINLYLTQLISGDINKFSLNCHFAKKDRTKEQINIYGEYLNDIYIIIFQYSPS